MCLYLFTRTALNFNKIFIFCVVFSGHFLLWRVTGGIPHVHITSPFFESPREQCYLQVWIYQEDMIGSEIKVILHNSNKTQVVIATIEGNNSKK